MQALRWTGFGVVDGIVGGALAGMAVLTPSFWDAGAAVGETVGFVAVVGSVYGGIFGVVIGAVGGLLIDLLRRFRLPERFAVWVVPVALVVLAVAVWHASDWGDLAFPAVVIAVVGADLAWRLRRVARPAVTMGS